MYLERGGVDASSSHVMSCHAIFDINHYNLYDLLRKLQSSQINLTQTEAFGDT